MKLFSKRFLPFFAAFALGLIIAGLFVAAPFPGFRFRRDFRHSHHCRMNIENQQLRERINQLEMQLSDQHSRRSLDQLNLEVPPPMPRFR